MLTSTENKDDVVIDDKRSLWPVLPLVLVLLALGIFGIGYLLFYLFTAAF